MNLRNLFLVLALLASGVFAVLYLQALRHELRPETPLVGPPPTSLPAAAFLPRPEFPPAQVVNLVFDAMKTNDHPYPNAGIATAWAFAAEEWKQRPEADFLALATSGPFYPIYRQTRRDLEQITLTDSLAVYDIRLTDTDGQTTTYRAFLTRRFTGPHPGCWLLTGLMPHRPGQPLPTHHLPGTHGQPPPPPPPPSPSPTAP